jgi:hypothetical protein
MLLVKVVFLKQEVIKNKKTSLNDWFFYFLYFSNLFFKSSGLNPKISNKIITIKTTKKIDTAKAIGIHKGEVTHHHDQSIFPVNLRIKNTMKRTPAKLKPEDEFFDAIILIYT